MWRMKRAMKITNKCLMKEKMRVRFCFPLISNACVRLLCGQILQLSLYFSVESLLYSYIILTKK